MLPLLAMLCTVILVCGAKGTLDYNKQNANNNKKYNRSNPFS